MARLVTGGTRVGVTQGSAPRHQSDHGAGEQLPRIRVPPYWCAKGHETRLVFLKLPDEQIPRMWDCPKCGSPATRDPGHAAPPTRPEDEIFKSHLDYVKERRSSQDAEVVLAGALERLRARGGSFRTSCWGGTRDAAFSSISHSVLARPAGPAAGTCTGLRLPGPDPRRRPYPRRQQPSRFPARC